MRATKLIAAILGAVALLVAALAFLADTAPGHRFIAHRIAALSPQTGLKIRIGRIDGSIYSQAEIHDLALSDPQGVFFTAPRIELDWTPLAWLNNKLDIDRLHAKTARLDRLPKLRPGKPGQPILPGFDIHIGTLAIDRLFIGAKVAGKPRIGRLSGRADIHDRRALVDLVADAEQGDHLALMLDAAPDHDRFDMDATLNAPAKGVFGAMLGTQRPVALRLAGDGSWRTWRGHLTAQIERQPAADIALSAHSGRYALTGKITAAHLLSGRMQRMTAPVVTLAGEGRLEKRRFDGHLSVQSAALIAEARGAIDLATSGFDDLLITARLRQPAALMPSMAGQNVTLKARFDGAFKQAAFDYLLTAPRIAFGQTGLEDVRASGQGRLSKSPVKVPIRLSARRITGVGDVAGGILANISVEGVLLATPAALVGDGLVLRSDKLNGKLALFVDLKTGRYDIGLAGQLTRYLIPGIGLVDVRSELKVVPGPDGRGTRILGRGEAWVRRFDNAFFLGLAGGLPKLETALERTPDGVLHFTNLRIIAPHLHMTLAGVRRRDGTFQLTGSGAQSTYGPLRLSLDGQIARPRIDLLLARPNDALGLAMVRVLLTPNASGFAWQASGQSRIGRFTGNGGLLLPPGGAARILVADLTASGVHGEGQFTAVPGGLTGELALSGSTAGKLMFDMAGRTQRIRAGLALSDAHFEGPPTIAVRRGRFDGTILLEPDGARLDGTLTARGVDYGGLGIARLAGNVRMKGGEGELRGAIAGSRGRSFDLQTVVRVEPDKYTVIGSGSVDGRPISLDGPAVLVREGLGWRLSPTELQFAGGRASLSGLIGGQKPELTGMLTAMPLTILDIISPKLGLGGVASGTFFYTEEADGAPSGRIDGKVRGLSRSGLALSSRPVDMAVVASFGGGRAGARLIAASGGQTIGRGQVQLSGLAGVKPLATRIANAALFGQLRYNGDAGTLWRLTGVETFDLSGNVAIGADISGRLADPAIRGSVRTTAARVESAAAGMVLTNVAANGQFDGSRLVFDGFSATAGKGGRVTGSGTINFSAENRGLDIALQADSAQLIARDDLGATVTGPLRIRSDGNGGTISGKVRLERSAYVLGQSAAVAAVPRLKIREINGGTDQPAAVAVPARPWMLDVEADAPGRLMVSGLGLDSEWRATLSVQGSLFAPAITGAAELVRGGYEFAGRRFELQRGVIRFRGESPPDPILDIVAAGDTQGLSAIIRVSGTGLKPDIAFSSVPALPQDELLSRLLFGTSITSLSAPEAVQLAAAVASMRGGAGLNPINALRKAVGLDRLRILPADTSTGQRTSVAAGKYITRRTFVEIITDGQGYSATRAEFQVTRWLSILSTVSTIGKQSASVRISKDY
jgi:translocation and assembly module TamB